MNTARKWIIYFFWLTLLSHSQANDFVKPISGGPTFIFETNDFVPFVNLYLLIDKIPFDNEFVPEYQLKKLENALTALGAICHTISGKNLPELPFNFTEQTFLIARFSSDVFEKQITEILSYLLLLKTSGKFLVYDQNIYYQQRKLANPFFEPETLFKRLQLAQKLDIDPVTLRPHMYLLISGKFNIFKTLRTLNQLYPTDTNSGLSNLTIVSEKRYWLVVLQKFLVDVLKNQSKPRYSDCLHIFAPISLKQEKIIVCLKDETSLAFTRSQVLKAIESAREKFQQWYFNDYLQHFNWLHFENDTRALLRLYSTCYVGSDALFRFRLKINKRIINRFFEKPQQFIEIRSHE